MPTLGTTRWPSGSSGWRGAEGHPAPVGDGRRPRAPRLLEARRRPAPGQERLLQFELRPFPKPFALEHKRPGSVHVAKVESSRTTP